MIRDALPAAVQVGTPPRTYRPTDRFLILRPQGRPARHYPIYVDADGGEVVAAWLVQEHPEPDENE